MTGGPGVEGGEAAAAPPAAAPPTPAPQSRLSPFAGRVGSVFATRVIQFGLTLLTTFLVARLLGPDGKGVYSLVLLMLTTLFALGQFGLPSATVFFSGRGRSMASLQRLALTLTVAASAVLVVIALLLLPSLEQNLLRAAPDDLLRLVLLGVPLQFASALAGSILYGRQRIRTYNLILIGQTAALLVLSVVLVGVLRLGPRGAVVAYLVTNLASTTAVIWEVRRAAADERASDAGRAPVGAAEFLRYGAQLYPANVTSFFNYRADVFLLSWLLVAPPGQPDAVRVAIGLYSLAVNFAEVTFYVPDSVSTIFYPRVAASDRAEADRSVAGVTRAAMLATLAAAAAIVPAAFVMVELFLRAYRDSLPAMLILMPAILGLSLSKVLASYVSGLGSPLPVAAAASTAMVVNIGANLLLIPVWGIYGAATASLISYSIHAAIMVTIARHYSRLPLRAFLLPTTDDARRLSGAVLGALQGAAEAVRR